MRRVLRHLRPLAYVLVGMAIAGGGTYALAATRGSNVLVACASKKTGVLRLKTKAGRCKRGQRRVTWNRRGPAGAPGIAGTPGAPGAPGTAAVNNWAYVTNSGAVEAGQNVSVQHVATGTFTVAITGACADRANAPTVTVEDSSPPDGTGNPHAFPVAWFLGDGNDFTVYTGVVSGGAFAPSDLQFTLMDTCD